MTARELLADLPHRWLQGNPDVTCETVAYDSRQITPGAVFIAIRGSQVDGHEFLETTAAAGAALAIVEEEGNLPASIGAALVPDARMALAKLAARFYGYPARKLRLIGITGTNGKTSVAYLLRHLLSAAGRSCGLIGTIEYDLGDRIVPAARTTPEALELHQSFAAMHRSACEFCVMEISSHALAQQRVAGLEFAATAFTNLTQDHLDYHGDMESYFATKRQLFTMSADDAVQCVNGDDHFGRRLADEFGLQTVGEKNATYPITVRELRQASTVFAMNGMEYTMPLIGRHNVANASLALALAQGTGVEAAACAQALAQAPAVPGRLEPVDCGQPFAVYVDYAHTDDALRQVLRTLREITPGKLHVVFGCGGNRDSGKRAKMGAVAAELSDFIYLTTDNPRRESPETIISQIAEGCATMRDGGWQEELDRERAIDETLRAARAGDTVLIAGKGHETYQEINDTIQPFDDRKTARTILNAMGNAH
jgi:UDP-N-acetylmuramoyl-L-alanyl-D-glutamate--2,6-diaminopimelate ligase